MASLSPVKTRCFLVSDTHGQKDLFKHLLSKEQFDVAIHCGDLTQDSYYGEFQNSIDLLASINAKLKIVIAGNHDWTLDDVCFRNKLEAATYDQGTSKPDESNLQDSAYRGFGEARALLDARGSGITFLDEGNHDFILDNGARLRVFASSFTPAMDDDISHSWGFQYDSSMSHRWNVAANTDIVVTHGPPHGILDLVPNASGIPDDLLEKMVRKHGKDILKKLGAAGEERAGCPKLFQAIARARPKLHCFGHIHSSWGARMVTWPASANATKSKHSSVVDDDLSYRIAALAEIDSDVEHCHASYHGERGQSTLFVNAAIQGGGNRPVQPAWIVDIDLDRA